MLIKTTLKYLETSCSWMKIAVIRFWAALCLTRVLVKCLSGLFPVSHSLPVLYFLSLQDWQSLGWTFCKEVKRPVGTPAFLISVPRIGVRAFTWEKCWGKQILGNKVYKKPFITQRRSGIRMKPEHLFPKRKVHRDHTECTRIIQMSSKCQGKGTYPMQEKLNICGYMGSAWQGFLISCFTHWES